MLQFSRFKTWAILASVLIAFIYALPNMVPASVQAPLRQYLGAKPVTLGLDLQGGSNVVVEVDNADLKTQLLRQLSGDIRATLREAKIAYKGIAANDSGVTVNLSNVADGDTAKTELIKLQQPLTGGLLDAAKQVTLYDVTGSGEQISFKFSDAGYQAKVSLAVKQSLGIIRNRLDATGVSEITVQQQGKDRIVIQVPGVQNPEKIKDLLNTTAKLTFQLLCAEQPTGANQNPPQECAAFPLKEDAKKNSETKQIIWVQTSSRATVDGADLTDAQASFDQNNRPIVSIKFNQKGSLRFGKLTSENVGKPFAIILDSKVISYPNINEPILGGSAQISGSFTPEETASLAINLRSGALPAKLTIVEERTVGPSLGSDSIRAGLIASIVGLVGVLIFMLIVYHLFGVFANVALLANLLMLLAIMSVMGFTLTLPGIAGVVLTMGMAVDSNVLVYERIREEWRGGRTALNAIETGFKAAFATILDANLTTLIAAFVLFGVGSGPVRGFAVTLSIGIITTVFTAYTLTRLIVAWWVKVKRPKEVPL
jgi:protein-export membrane protein SecD